MADPSSSSSQNGEITILQSLQTVLRSHLQSYPNLSSPYLHPYAPLSPTTRKGKGRELIANFVQQLDKLREVREALGVASQVLTGKGGEEEREQRNKLTRSLKEVITHQSNLIPLRDTLSTLPSTSLNQKSIPSNLILLPPVQLLTTLAKNLNIQTYLEESQFGLLKTSLALAGNRFVVDVDLEVDAGVGEDEDEEMEVDGATTSETVNGGGEGETDEGRGKVRLSKLTANHVTVSGATGVSHWVASVLKSRLIDYLDVWNNGSQGDNDGERGIKLESLIKGLEGELRDLKDLDDLVAGSAGLDGVDGKVEGQSEKMEVDWFVELEVIAGHLQKTYAKDGIRNSIHLSRPPSVLPRFNLISHESSRISPMFLLRPAFVNENLPSLSRVVKSDGSSGMIVHESDISLTGAVDSGIAGSWVIEVIKGGGQANRLRGIPVPRSWLAPLISTEAQESSIKGHGNQWDGLVKVEELLLQQTHVSADITSTAKSSRFPYNSTFTHSLPPLPAQNNLENRALIQHWSLSQAGSEGFIIGRLPLPSSWEIIDRLIEALREQVALNQLFSSVFKISLLDRLEDEGHEQNEDLGDDFDDLMSTPTAIPISAALTSTSIEVSFPLPLEQTSSSSAPGILNLIISPTGSSTPQAQEGDVSVEWKMRGLDGEEEVFLSEKQRTRVENAVQVARGCIGFDLVQIVREIEVSLRNSNLM